VTVTERVTYEIVTIPGDGIGPEVLEAGLRVMEAAGQRFGFDLHTTEIVVGGCAIDAYGVPIRDEDLQLAHDSDAVYLGAIGGPKWDDPNAKIRPEQSLFALRGGLELFGNLRPVAVHPSLVEASPVRPELVRGTDLLIVRELTSGLYFGRPSEERETNDGLVAVDTCWYTEDEVRRVAKLAFELARSRRKHLTSVDKANVLATSRLWRKIVDEVHADYQDVHVEHRLVDSCSMALIKQPNTFDVLVTENLFGDILSDEASVLAGSLGMLPSASLGARRTAHGLHGLYEPCHGSAPYMTGMDKANPVATILSGGMMLRWSLGQTAAADAVEAAVGAALDDGYRTPDLTRGWVPENLKAVGTKAMTEAVIERVATVEVPTPVEAR
jgi:3-isopropylmalate dehydrogenase